MASPLYARKALTHDGVVYELDEQLPDGAGFDREALIARGDACDRAGCALADCCSAKPTRARRSRTAG